MMNMTKPITHNGLRYRSLSELAGKYGISRAALSYRLKQGMSLDEALKTKRKQNVNKRNHIEYKGQVYPSYRALSEATGADYGTMRKKIKAGYSVDEALSKPRNQRVNKNSHIEYKGQVYPTYTALAEATGISYRAMLRRLKEGYSIDEAVAKPRKQNVNKKYHIEFEGEHYPTYKALSEATGVEYNTLISRIKVGYSIYDAVKGTLDGKPMGIKRELIEFEGEYYPSYIAIARKYKVNEDTFKSRRTNGWTIHECIYGKNEAKIKYEGVTYPSYMALAKAFGVNVTTFYARRRRGWTIPECIHGSWRSR